jgi:hypothetical protein
VLLPATRKITESEPSSLLHLQLTLISKIFLKVMTTVSNFLLELLHKRINRATHKGWNFVCFHSHKIAGPNVSSLIL